MRKPWGLLIIVLIMIVGLAMLSGCGILGSGSSEGGESGGDAENGSLDEIDLSGDGENGELDEIDLSMGCPEDPFIFFMHLDYQLNVEEDDGYLYERTDPSVGVPVSIHGSQITDLEPGDVQGERIPVTIEGESGDCSITGMAEISLAIGGTCQSGVATLDIEGTYEIYHRSINCPGEPPVEFTDSLFPGPSVTADFNIAEAGDTFDFSQDMGEVEFVYKWTLKPGYPYQEID